MRSIRYLFIEGGRRFVYRRRVPSDVVPALGKRWIKITLRTTNREDAEARCRALAAEHDRLIKAARAAPTGETIQRLVDDVASTYAEIIAGTGAHSEHAALRDALAAVEARALSAASQRTSELSPDERARVVDAGGLESFYRDVRREQRDIEREARADAWRAQLGLKTPTELSRAKTSRDVRARHARDDATTLARVGLGVEPVEPTNPRISQLMRQWLAAGGQRANTARNHVAAINRFIAIVGDMHVRDVTRTDCRKFVETLGQLADPRRLPVAKRSALTYAAPGARGLSVATIKRQRDSLVAMMQFAMDQDFIASNPASRLKTARDTRPLSARRRDFTAAEITAVMAYIRQRYGAGSDWMRFVLLAIYTGARRSELSQLAASNVRMVDGVPAVVIDDADGRRVKTLASVRTIPLHPDIADAALRWAGEKAGGPMFPALARYRVDASDLSNQFRAILRRAGIDDSRVCLHSLRHNFRSAALVADVPETAINALQGHAGRTVAERYGRWSLPALAREVAKIRFPVSYQHTD